MEEKFPGIIIREELAQELNIKEDRIQVMQFACLVYKGFVFVRPSYTMSPRPKPFRSRTFHPQVCLTRSQMQFTIKMSIQQMVL